MGIAALLLTGGSSRRMGVDKAGLVGPDGRALALRTAELLGALTTVAVEVGPGYSPLPAVPDDRPGEGPLAAVATGARALRARGWDGSTIVVATDLPLLDAGFLAWLGGHPFAGSVVPVVAGRPQWLCARYEHGTLAGAEALVAAGTRRMAALAAGGPLHLASPDEWAGASLSPLAPADADTPEALDALLEAGRAGGGIVSTPPS